MPLPTAPFDPAESLYAGLSVLQLKLLPQLTGVAAEADDDVVTKAAHGLVNGQLVQYVSGTGFTGLVAGTNYFVRDRADNTFKLAATKGGAAIDITVDGTVGVFAPVSVFEVMELDDNPSQTEVSIKRPDAKGRMRPRRTVESEASEVWSFGLDEVKRLLEIFSGKMRGRVNATATIWITDPDDTAGNVALKSQTDFAVSITRDGSMKHGGGQFSKATIKMTSQHSDDITWAKDSAA